MSLDFGPFIFGGNVFGWTVSREDSFRLLDAFVAQGGKAIDTADVYSAWVPGNTGGDSERLIGEWQKSRGNRSDLVLATKVGMWGDQPGLSKANILSAVEGSLKRLQTDYIDLYYAHKDDESVSQLETLEAFDTLIKQGKVRVLGASNFSSERLNAALSLSKTHNLASYQFCQDQWSLVERGIERDLVGLLAKEGLKQLPYFALASGFLSGKYRPGQVVESQRASRAASYLESEKNLKLLALLDSLSERYQTSIAAISLAWVKSQSVVETFLASARTLEQLPDLFAGASLKLQEQDIKALSELTA